MTVFTTNLNSSARLVVEVAIAMDILAKMTVNTMHALFEVNVLEMDCFTKLQRIVW